MGKRPTASGARSWVVLLGGMILLCTSCRNGTAPGETSASSSQAVSASVSGISGSPSPSRPPALDDVCPQAPAVPGLNFAADDGTRLYGAVMGREPVGIVMANDVPHSLCEEVAEAATLAHRGFRVLVFDYRGHGESEAGSDRGRLDLDVVGAAAELRRLGSDHVFLMGFYAGGAIALVASTEIDPGVSGVVAVSAAARRGQFVNGPYSAPGALDVAPRLRVPVLFLSVRTDRFVPLSEDRQLYRLTGSADKHVTVFPYGGGGLDLFDLSPFADRANRLVRRFVRTHAG